MIQSRVMRVLIALYAAHWIIVGVLAVCILLYYMMYPETDPTVAREFFQGFFVYVKKTAIIIFASVVLTCFLGMLKGLWVWAFE